MDSSLVLSRKSIPKGLETIIRESANGLIVCLLTGLIAFWSFWIFKIPQGKCYL